ncbi:hypothetical protein [Adhaeretor mobilis]|uniref:Uncharacterized protein n=1 Tax=Adhaeretor mobilis TaxID=1930276 RepID=A0A517MSS9_9BACT|nr:hypothetical protein [Adhaeretor mobilis]QDS97919.1 hypothetical protein HG15A2_11870 [Adhaeretor mobilis]
MLFSLQLCILLFNVLDPTSLAHATDAGKADEQECGPVFMLDLTQPMQHTMMGFNHQGPPPWLNGNIAATQHQSIVNIHSENLLALKKCRGFRSLAVRSIGERWLMVVDERVGNGWLLSRPFYKAPPEQLELLGRYRKHFRLPVQAKNLIGTSWELAERQQENRGLPFDVPRDILTRMMPGNTLEFQRLSVACKNTPVGTEVERGWFIIEGKDTGCLLICDKDDVTDDYEAITFEILELDDALHLIPLEYGQGSYSGGTGSTNLQVNNNTSYVRYRRIINTN